LDKFARAPERGIADRTAAAAAAAGLVVGSDTHKHQAAVVVAGLAAIDQVYSVEAIRAFAVAADARKEVVAYFLSEEAEAPVVAMALGPSHSWVAVAVAVAK